MDQFWDIWKAAHEKYNMGHSTHWSSIERKNFARPLLKEAGSIDVLKQSIDATFADWPEYMSFVKDHLGWNHSIAATPTIAFVYSTRKGFFDFPHQAAKKQKEADDLTKLFTAKVHKIKQS